MRRGVLTRVHCTDLMSVYDKSDCGCCRDTLQPCAFQMAATVVRDARPSRMHSREQPTHQTGCNASPCQATNRARSQLSPADSAMAPPLVRCDS